MKLVISFFLMLSTCAAWAQDNVVRWGRTDFPPFTILNGAYAGQGVTDRMIDFYIRHLPDYKHEKVEGSLQRVLTNMRNGDHLCHGALLWKEKRAQFADYLKANIVMFANGIIIRKEAIPMYEPYMVDAGTVDLEKLVKAGKVKIRYHAERSYSPVIDRIIEAYAGKSPVLAKKTGLKQTEREISLMLDGRLDGVLGRPEEGRYAIHLLESDRELAFLSIAGDEPYHFSQVACAKGNWNKQFIKDVDALTLKYRTSEEFAQFYAQWLPESLRARYFELVRTVFTE